MANHARWCGVLQSMVAGCGPSALERCGTLSRCTHRCSSAGRRNLDQARELLAEDLVFEGLFETYRSAEEYLRALKGLLEVTVRLDVRQIIAQGDHARRSWPR